MSRTRHTEAQMIAALKRVEAGRAVEDVAREVGVSRHTIYAWKAKYGEMDVCQAQEAKQLRNENTRLRKLLADFKPGQRSVAVGDPKKTAGAHSAEGRYRGGEAGLRLQRATCVPPDGAAVTTYRYRSRRSDEPLRGKLVETGQTIAT